MQPWGKDDIDYNPKDLVSNGGNDQEYPLKLLMIDMSKISC